MKRLLKKAHFKFSIALEKMKKRPGYLNRNAFLLLVFISVLWIFLYSKTWFPKLLKLEPLASTDNCNFVRADHIVGELCHMYNKEKIIVGSLCEDLCNKRSFEVVRCYNNFDKDDVKRGNFFHEIYDSYKAVLVLKIVKEDNAVSRDNSMMRLGDEFVVKSRHKFFQDYEQYTFNLEELTQVDQLNSFLINYLNSTLVHNFEFLLDSSNNFETLLKRLSGNFLYNELYLKARENKDVRLVRNYIFNLLTLLQQEEYTFVRYFKDRKHILDTYGSCGHFYSIEYAKSLNRKVRDLDNPARKSLAIEFLEMIEYFDKEIYLKNLKDLNPNRASVESKPIQICDVKLDNFGINRDNELKVIDTDMVHLDSIIYSESVCRKDDDCHYFDCKSYCDKETKKCSRKRFNNNLQSFCDKIFTNNLYAPDGLLQGLKIVSIESRANLDSLLIQCITKLNQTISYSHIEDVSMSFKQFLDKLL